MALPAGMGLSAAARAAGFDCQTLPPATAATSLLESSPPLPPPPPLPIINSRANNGINADNNSRSKSRRQQQQLKSMMDGDSSDDPEDELLGGLAALSEPLPQHQQQQQQKTLGTRPGTEDMMEGDGGGTGGSVVDDDPAGMAGSVAAAAAAAAMAAVSAAPQRDLPAPPPLRPAMPPRIHTVTSPPPPKPAPSMAAAIVALRMGTVGALPTRGGVGIRAVVCGKRGRDALRASEALSEEVVSRFPRQAEQAARLSAVEDKLDKKINTVRRRLLSKIDSVEWTTKSLRCWLSLEVLSDSDTARRTEERGSANGPEEDANGGSKRQGQGEWCVLAKLQGTIINPPDDGVERRFSSFFSKIALQLDAQAFPEVQAVEWVRSGGCEELHCVELRLPLAGPLSMGLKEITVQVFLHSRMDDDRPRRFVLSAPLRRALRLTKQVQTKVVLVAAVCEALRHRGLMQNGGDRMMLSCDEQLEALFGTMAFPFHKLEEALGPHVQPADPPALHATISLEEGKKTEKQLDVKVDTEAAFQLHAVRALVGGGGVIGGRGQGGREEGEQGYEEDAEGGDIGDRALGIPTAVEMEKQSQLDRQIAYLVEEVNASGRRAAMLRELSTDPLSVVPRLEAQLLADQETLAADAGIERPARLGEVEPWHDDKICDLLTSARADARRQEEIREAHETERRARALQAFRAECAMRAAQQQRLKLREAQERAIMKERERNRRQQQMQHQQRQAALEAQRQQQQRQRQARAAAEDASRLAREQAAAAAAAAASVKEQGLSAAAGMQQSSEAFLRMRQLQQQQQQGLPSPALSTHLASHHHPQHSQLSSSTTPPIGAPLTNPNDHAGAPNAPMPALRQHQLPPLQQAVASPLQQGQGAQNMFTSRQHHQQQQQYPQQRTPSVIGSEVRGPISHPHLPRDSQPQQSQMSRSGTQVGTQGSSESRQPMDAASSQNQLEQTLLSQNDDGEEELTLLQQPKMPADAVNKKLHLFGSGGVGEMARGDQQPQDQQSQRPQHQGGPTQGVPMGRAVAHHVREPEAVMHSDWSQHRSSGTEQESHQQVPQRARLSSRHWGTTPTSAMITTPLRRDPSGLGSDDDGLLASADPAAVTGSEGKWAGGHHHLADSTSISVLSHAFEQGDREHGQGDGGGNVGGGRDVPDLGDPRMSRIQGLGDSAGLAATRQLTEGGTSEGQAHEGQASAWSDGGAQHQAQATSLYSGWQSQVERKRKDPE